MGGELFGGATDILEAYRTGRLQQALERAGVEYRRDVKLDPFSLLPGWLNKR